MATGKSVIATIADHNRELVRAAKERVSLEEMRELALATAQPEGVGGGAFERALRRPGLSFVCEVKRASPSKGLIAREFDPVSIAGDYERAGADAVSCLTEPAWFQGSLDHLAQVAAAVRVPVMRKDFVVDPYQLYEARCAGASAVLLLCAVLSDEELALGLSLAEELGMAALVEAYDPGEVRRAVDVGARIIGVNNRDLRDFSVDFENAARMRELVPPGCVYVAESGVGSLDDVARVAGMGADAVLVGEFLMRSHDRVGLLGAMRSAACVPACDHAGEAGANEGA